MAGWNKLVCGMMSLMNLVPDQRSDVRVLVEGALSLPRQLQLMLLVNRPK